MEAPMDTLPPSPKTQKTEDWRRKTGNWQDKKRVTMPTTLHNGANVTDSGKKGRKNGLPVFKLQVVLDYNQGMGGIDHEDQQPASFPII